MPCIPDSCLACPLLVPAGLPRCLEAYYQKYPVFIGFPFFISMKTDERKRYERHGVDVVIEYMFTQLWFIL